ncbi:hypothetical protein ACFOY2_16680 [Nonomuraea purpurea]|uniref:Uncharacterized protein n=1 Tax=Nonomuraea purpurea TaxID=1849276 RepID=A0ABV8G6V9_9ACTN
MATLTLRGSLSVAMVACMVPGASADTDPDTKNKTKTKTEPEAEPETEPEAENENEAENETENRERRRRRHHFHHHDIGHGRCSPRTFFRIHMVSPRNFFLPRTRYIDGPGGSMTVSVTREHEVVAFIETEREQQRETRFTAESTPTAEFTPSEVVRRLRRLGLPHLEERHMVFSGHEYTREVKKGMYGNMWYRVFGYRVGWSAWSVVGTCREVEVARGIANVPARVEGWRYWETKHPTFKRRLLSLK